MTEPLTHPTSTGKLWDRQNLVILGLGILCLLPTLMMPLGQDQATFFRGGRAMLEGGSLYVDFIDVKPPLGYLLYGFGGMLFGSSAFAIRVFDVLWQSTTLLALLALMRSYSASRLWTAITVIMFAMIYTQLGHAPTAQNESLFALPLIGIMALMRKSNSWQRDLGIGALCGVAFLLKYPFAVVGPAIVLLWWMRGDGWKQVLTSTLRIGLGSAVVIAAVIGPMMADPRFWPAFKEVIDYLGVYAGRTPLSLQSLTFGLKTTATFFGDNLSIVVTAAFIVGFLRANKTIHWESVWLFVFLAFSVAIERKFAPYHYARLYVPLAIVAGYGAVYMWEKISASYASGASWQRATIVAALVTAVLFSPIPRLSNITRLSVGSISDPSVYEGYLTRPADAGFDYTAIGMLEDDLEERLTATDNVMIISLMATPIVPFLKTTNTGPFADAHFYHGVGAAPSWKQRAADQMRAADVVVIDTIDQCTGMTLHPYTSWQAIQREPELWSILQERFERVDTVACFYIYEPRK